jgi:hypothetical protein
MSARQEALSIGLVIQRELDKFACALERDKLISDDISTRFEMCTRLEELKEWLVTEITYRIEDAAGDIASDADFERSEEIIASLQELVDSLEEETKGTRGKRKERLAEIVKRLSKVAEE